MRAVRQHIGGHAILRDDGYRDQTVCDRKARARIECMRIAFSGMFEKATLVSASCNS